jgi:hypothetical protein
MIDRLEQEWTRDIFEAMFPGCGRIDLELFREQTLAAMPRPSAVLFRLAIAGVTLAPLLRRRASFGQLDPTAKQHVLDRLAGSDVYLARAVFTMLKATAAMACAAAVAR